MLGEGGERRGEREGVYVLALVIELSFEVLDVVLQILDLLFVCRLLLS